MSADYAHSVRCDHLPSRRVRAPVGSPGTQESRARSASRARSWNRSDVYVPSFPVSPAFTRSRNPAICTFCIPYGIEQQLMESDEWNAPHLSHTGPSRSLAAGANSFEYMPAIKDKDYGKVRPTAVPGVTEAEA